MKLGRRVQQRKCARAETTAGSSVVVEAPAHQTRILIADDDGVTRRLLSLHLQDWGYEVTEAPPGASALSARAGSTAPRITIIDWEMATQSGVPAYRILRGRPGP